MLRLVDSGQWAQSALESELEAGTCACRVRADQLEGAWGGLWTLYSTRYGMDLTKTKDGIYMFQGGSCIASLQRKAAWAASGSFAPSAFSKSVGRGATT